MTQSKKGHFAKVRITFKLLRSFLCVAIIAMAFIYGNISIANGKAASDTSASVANEPKAIELALVTHLDMDLPEQDVFIEREPGSDKVFRVTKGDHDLNAPLYKAAVPVKHDPFDPAAIGPHPKGERLGLTLGQWLQHRGVMRYVCSNGEGRLEAELSGLVPSGVYTLWHAFIALPPTKPFSGTLDLPLGARDGSESVFKANAAGRANLHRIFKPCLEMSDVWTSSMLAINWHSDGKTYGADPGAFGYNAHVPLFVILPPRDGIQ